MKTESGAAPRAASAWALQQVLMQQRSLTQAMPEAQQKFKLSPRDKALTQAMVFGVLRQLPALEWLLAQLVEKPLKSKVRVVHCLLLAGIFQLRDMRTAAHAAIGETVSATPLLRQKALRGFVNAVLRSYQRQQQQLESQLNSQPDKLLGHPGWLLRALKQHYPEHWQHIIAANNSQAPMWLRVNQRLISTQQYGEKLTQAGISFATDPQLPQAILLQKPSDVLELPGFEQGQVSVQDGAAQLAALLLEAQDGERILDACAAPGGKTAHILELTDCHVTAMDIDPLRLQRVESNLQRLQLQAQCIEGDAAEPDNWWNGQLFDRILLDAPCSATGVIRRHPDIKWLRRETDIARLAKLQQRILQRQWQLLKPGGTLLYATCSVLPQENEQQIHHFLENHSNAELLPLAQSIETATGWQLLPGENQRDGFYYARLHKRG